MPKKRVHMPKKRVQLDLSPTTMRRLESVVYRTEAGSQAEAVRKAIKFYDICLEHRDRGGELIMRDADGSESKLVLLEGMAYGKTKGDGGAENDP